MQTCGTNVDIAKVWLSTKVKIRTKDTNAQKWKRFFLLASDFFSSVWKMIWFFFSECVRGFLIAFFLNSPCEIVLHARSLFWLYVKNFWGNFEQWAWGEKSLTLCVEVFFMYNFHYAKCGSLLKTEWNFQSPSITVSPLFKDTHTPNLFVLIPHNLCQITLICIRFLVLSHLNHNKLITLRWIPIETDA